MLIVQSLPFFDTRPFISEPYMAPKPNWGDVRPTDFLAGFGRATTRLRGGSPYWAGEGVHFDAHLAIQFPGDLRRRMFGPADGRCGLACEIRRLYGSPLGLFRIEVGYSRRNWTPKQPLGGDGLAQLIEDAAGNPVTVGKGGAPDSLFALSTQLAERIQTSTSRRGSAAEPSPIRITRGQPMMLVEYLSHEVRELPEYADEVTVPDAAAGLSVHLLRQFRRGGRLAVPTWFIGIDAEQNNRTDARQLRLHLIRRHAERESLRRALDGLTTGQLEVSSESSHGRRTIELLREAERVFGLVLGAPTDRPEDVEQAFRLDNLIQRDVHQTLVTSLRLVAPGLADMLSPPSPPTVSVSVLSVGNVTGDHIAIGHNSAA